MAPEEGRAQAFNRYSYALSNPIRYSDPNGHDACDNVPSNWVQRCKVGLTANWTDGLGTSNGMGIKEQGTKKEQSWIWRFDTQLLFDKLPYSSEQWAQAGMTIDGAALAGDFALNEVVWAVATAGAFAGTIFEGGPVPGGVSGFGAGWISGETLVLPLNAINNGIATVGTAMTIISEAKTGANRLAAEAEYKPGYAIRVELTVSIGNDTQIAIASTGLGWIAPTVEASLVLQGATVASDLDLFRTPWGNLSLTIPFIVPLTTDYLKWSER